MEKTDEPDQSKAMLDKNREFHDIIIAAANSPRLADLLEQYYSQSQQYRALAREHYFNTAKRIAQAFQMSSEI